MMFGAKKELGQTTQERMMHNAICEKDLYVQLQSQQTCTSNNQWTGRIDR